MITHWRKQLKNDLTFHSYIIEACNNANDQNNKLKTGISVQEFSTFLDKKACNKSDFLEPHELEKYLSSFVSHNIILIDPDKYIFLLSRSLLDSAFLIYKENPSITKIENEVFKFIRGDLTLDSYCINNFRSATLLIKSLYRNIINHKITERKLRSQLERNLCSDSKDKKIEVINAFIEVGFAKKLFTLNKTEHRDLTINGEGNIWFLLSSLFGLHSDIEGLPALFYGTLPLYNPPGNNIFIRGGLGCGKSTLASQIAYEVANKGGISIYLALEENTAILENLYASFGWTNEEDIIYETIS